MTTSPQRSELILDLARVWPGELAFLATEFHLELLPEKWAGLSAKRLDVLLHPYPPELATKRRLIGTQRVAGRERWQMRALLGTIADDEKPADQLRTVLVELTLDPAQLERLEETLAAFAGDPGRVRVIR